MNDLRMFTQEEVANLLHAHVTTITMLREVGVIRAIKTGRNYMFSATEIVRFQDEYLGLDVSNRYKALESKEIVEKRREVS